MKKSINKNYSVVVIGGGISGICAALASAREGTKTALIHNRPVLGGNASSEIRMHICGAGGYMNRRPNSRETGIVEEILSENRYKNPQHSFSIFDTVLWEITKFQKNLDLYLNTHMTDVRTVENKVSEIIAEQLTTEKTFKFNSEIFIDTTGDATLAYLAGADCVIGREASETYNEKYAPEKSDDITMGSTLMFKAVDMGHPVQFIKPEWANTYTEEDLYSRGHSEISTGYWWIELGGDDLNTISDAEEIRDELLKAVYGVWDHIKNGGAHGAENYALDWVGFLPGKRESRRVFGDYILNETDLLEGKIFPDTVAYGGWPMDMHIPGGLKTKREPTTYIKTNGLYSIPYRCLYSRNIENLFIGGRAISVSHMAFGSTRVMATCGVVGQAIGTAAHLCCNNSISPRELASDVSKLQSLLMKNDCYLHGMKDEKSKLLFENAVVTASSYETGAEPENTINGYQRNINDKTNCWIAKGTDEWLDIRFNLVKEVKEFIINFDSNLSEQFMISISKKVTDVQIEGIPPEIVKEYKIQFYKAKQLLLEIPITNNYLRHNHHKLKEMICCDRIHIEFKATHGYEKIKVFEVKVYQLNLI